VTVDENDFIIDPSQVLPPPKLVGKVTSVWIEGDEVVQTFGSGPPPRLTPAAASTPERRSCWWSRKASPKASTRGGRMCRRASWPSWAASA
jgi:hypothetical protein